MKRIFLIFALLLCIALYACSAKPKYRDDIDCEDILKGAPLLERSADDYGTYDKDYVSFFFGDTLSFDGHTILYSKEQNDINEVGVFHAPDESTLEKMHASVTKYISEMQSTQRAFIASYAPEELSKLEGAQVRVYGNYVIYAILPTNDAEALFAHVEQVLKK